MPFFGGLLLALEALNALGVALVANPAGANAKIGGKLVIAAVVIQLVLISIFAVLATLFWKNCINVSKVRKVLIALYCSMGLVLVRSIYRLVEHSTDTKIDYKDLVALRNLTPLLRYEWFFYIFEAVPMLVNSILWNLWNPGHYLPRNRCLHLAEDDYTELEDMRKVDARPVAKKAANVLTFGMLYRENN
jgi:hypothetical protein